MKESAGTLIYRRSGKTWEVLIVQPSGPAARYGWSIPKGIPDGNESLEEAARRETLEETGCKPGALTYLGKIDYRKSKKRVHCFVGPAPDESPISNSWEIAAARYVSLDEALKLLHEDQRAFIGMFIQSMKTLTKG